MQPHHYTLGMLPKHPTSPDRQPLSLAYDPKTGEGTFSHGSQPLNLAGFYQETTLNSAQPTGIPRTRTTPASPLLPCGAWVSCFSAWPIPGDQLHTAHILKGHRTETEREAIDFSGFKFDEALQAWIGIWERRDWQQVFNSTFYQSTTVELTLNLLEGIGTYRESKLCQSD